MGFGRPVSDQAVLEIPEVLIFAWGHTIPMIASAVGVSLDRIDTVYEKWTAPARIPYQQGVIEAGQCAAVRFEIRGWVGSEARIVIEHVNRITNDVAPDWPRATSVENDAYRIIVKGSPEIVQETAFRDALTGDAVAGGCLATGMRAVNAVPYLDELPAGLVSALDLPLIPGVGVIR
jgi:4-hydroxy-tetrahydrodipicolinate reductase